MIFWMYLGLSLHDVFQGLHISSGLLWLRSPTKAQFLKIVRAEAEPKLKSKFQAPTEYSFIRLLLAMFLENGTSLGMFMIVTRMSLFRSQCACMICLYILLFCSLIVIKKLG